MNWTSTTLDPQVIQKCFLDWVEPFENQKGVWGGRISCDRCFGFFFFLSAMESHSLLNPNLQSSEGVLSSFRTTWQEFVEDLGFWRVLLLLVVIALLSLGIAYYVSGVLPFSTSQLELVHWWRGQWRGSIKRLCFFSCFHMNTLSFLFICSPDLVFIFLVYLLVKLIFSEVIQRKKS